MPELLRKLSGRASEVTRAWEGKAAVCIASGPSLTKQQLDIVQAAHERDAVRVLVVNDNYLVAPWADVLYFADVRWWKWQIEGKEKSWPWARFTVEEVRKAYVAFKGQKVTIQHTSMSSDPDVFVLQKGGEDGLSEDPKSIRTGQNGGFQGLNIVVLSGANPIYLIGYDMRFDGKRTHAHNGHPIKISESAYLGYAKQFSSLERPIKKLGVKVLNCSPGSKIAAFPMASLEQCLAPTA